MKSTMKFISLLSAMLILCVSFNSCTEEPLDTDKPTTENGTDNPSEGGDDTDKPETGGGNEGEGESEGEGNEGETPSEPPVEQQELIYYENLDKVQANGNNWTNFPGGFVNPQGSGAVSLEYKCSSSNVSVRASWNSRGYQGASGVNNVYFGNGLGWISISGISLNPSKNVYEISFGSYQEQKVLSYNSGNLKLYIGDGLNDREVDLVWSGPKSNNAWEIASAVVKFEGTVPSDISLTFESNYKNIRIDDIRVMTSDKTPTQSVNMASGQTPDEEDKAYAELPNTLKTSSDYKYVTHYATTYSSKKNVRNYSACYDIRRHNPMWVAYPFHAIYEEGGWTRPDVDPWRADPKFSENEQSIIYPADWQNYPNHSDNRRWSVLGGMSAYFGRGHLLMSANRGAGSKSKLLELNTQTFYPTNISPEYHKYPKHWEEIEYMLSDEWNCSDTVYVVAGCHYANDLNIIMDASWSGTNQSYSKACVVPTAHYKVFLRTKSGKTGKAVHQCAASELMAIGFWFEQKLDNKAFEAQPAISSITMSVADIEKRLGNVFDFFPNVPDEVKASYNVSDWPGLSSIINKTYPANVP